MPGWEPHGRCHRRRVLPAPHLAVSRQGVEQVRRAAECGGHWSETVVHLRVRRFFRLEMSPGQEVHHQLIEVVRALQRHQV
jgi:hypothetical protein